MGTQILKDEHRQIVADCARPVEEVLVDIRKERPEYKHVIEVDGTYWNGEDFVPVPAELKGFWMMSYGADLEYWKVHVMRDEWVKCEKKEVVTYEWTAMPDVDPGVR